MVNFSRTLQNLCRTSCCEEAFLSRPFHPCPPSLDSFQTNCENRKFRNSIWHLCWQICGFISV